MSEIASLKAELAHLRSMVERQAGKNKEKEEEAYIKSKSQEHNMSEYGFKVVHEAECAITRATMKLHVGTRYSRMKDEKPLTSRELESMLRPICVLLYRAKFSDLKEIWDKVSLRND